MKTTQKKFKILNFLKATTKNICLKPSNFVIDKRNGMFQYKVPQKLKRV